MAMNVLQVQNNLRQLTDQQLVGEMKLPSGAAPQFMVMSELQRRKDMRSDYVKQVEKSTVAEDLTKQFSGGIGQLPPAMAMQQSQPQPQMQQTQGMPGVQGYANGGPVMSFFDEFPGGAQSPGESAHDRHRQDQIARMHEYIDRYPPNTPLKDIPEASFSDPVKSLTHARNDETSARQELADAIVRQKWFGKRLDMLGLNGNGLYVTDEDMKNYQDEADQAANERADIKRILMGQGAISKDTAQHFASGGSVTPHGPQGYANSNSSSDTYRAPIGSGPTPLRMGLDYLRRMGAYSQDNPGVDLGSMPVWQLPNLSRYPDYVGSNYSDLSAGGYNGPTAGGYDDPIVAAPTDAGDPRRRGYVPPSPPAPAGGSVDGIGAGGSLGEPGAGGAPSTPHMVPPNISVNTPAPSRSYEEILKSIQSGNTDETAGIEDRLKQLAAASDKQYRQDKWGAVLQAGLGMMASHSPYLGQAIGEGGLKGMDAYRQAVEGHRQDDRQSLGADINMAELRQRAAAGDQNAAASLTQVDSQRALAEADQRQKAEIANANIASDNERNRLLGEQIGVQREGIYALPSEGKLVSWIMGLPEDQQQKAMSIVTGSRKSLTPDEAYFEALQLALKDPMWSTYSTEDQERRIRSIMSGRPSVAGQAPTSSGSDLTFDPHTGQYVQ